MTGTNQGSQDDVIRLTDVKGQTAARYQYDPYGNIIDSAGSHVDINPLRYRGYYYGSDRYRMQLKVT